MSVIAGITAAAAALAVAGLDVGSAAASAPSGAQYARAGFGVQTASDGKPDGRGIVTYGVTPGATQQDEFAVVNIGRKPLTLTVYATDATSGSDGRIGLRPSGAKPTDVGAWISIDHPTTVRVPARTANGPSFVLVPYTVAVPANAEPGDHIGGIVASLASSARNKDGVDVTLDQRVALSLVARVSGAVRARLAVEDLHVDYRGPSLTGGNPFADGSATVTYRVHNTGNVQLGGVQNVTLDPTVGGSVTSATTGVPTLLPGASAQQRIVVAGVYPGFSIDARVTVTPIAAPGATHGPLRPTTVTASVTAVPWLMIALVVLVALLLVVLSLRVRALRKKPRPTHRRSRGPSPAGAR